MSDDFVAADVMCLMPLFAAIDETLIKLIFFAVIGIIYLFNYLMGGRKDSAQKRQREERRKANEQTSQRPQTVAQRREVDEYQRSRQKEQRRPAAPPAKAKQPVAKKQPPRRLTDSPVDAEVVEAPGDSVSAHVSKHLQTKVFEQRAAHMTDDLSKADRDREEHLRKMFDHNLGRLSKPSVSSDAPAGQTAEAPHVAAQVTNLLTSPQSVRQAIVLNEILQRPADRW